jgi:L-alanine-DL-glutamate epimerase-like enolase superfamily enzyme
MKIVEVQWHNYRLPLPNSFITAHGVMTAREGIIVQITTKRKISGIGEIAPLPAFGGAGLADASSLLPALAAHLQNKTLDEALELVHAWGKTGTKVASAFSTPTLCGLEIALLDAIGKAEGCGVCTLLSPTGTVPRATVPVNAVIGALAPGAAIAIAREARNNGYRCVKLKVGLGDSIHEEVERVAAVRDAIGPTMHLRLDANEEWKFEEAIAVLSQCVPFNTVCRAAPEGIRPCRYACPSPGSVHPNRS